MRLLKMYQHARIVIGWFVAFTFILFANKGTCSLQGSQLRCGESGAPFRRIVWGDEVAVGAFPWMALIYLVSEGSKNQQCGSALITQSHVVTAAHCLVELSSGIALSPQNFVVRLGDHDLNSNNDGASPIEVTVQRVITHENFQPSTFQNDIAILELSNPVAFTAHISPICLPFHMFGGDDLQGRDAIVAGWGSTSEGGPLSPVLLETQVRIWANSDCEAAFFQDATITFANLCAGGSRTDACTGDSGGPLMLSHSDGKFYLIGIVSLGRGCGNPGVPGIYTRVTTYLNWIQANVP